MEIRRSSIVIALLTIGFLAALIGVVFLVISGGAALDDARRQGAFCAEENRVLKSLLLDLTSLDQAQAVALIHSKAGGRIVKVERDSVSVDSVVLKYNDRKLVSVCSLEGDEGASCVSRP